jgi:hypothetical protein
VEWVIADTCHYSQGCVLRRGSSLRSGAACCVRLFDFAQPLISLSPNAG